VKRATGFWPPTVGFNSRFNPRPREAGDLSSVPVVDFSDSFNPRPREAGDKITARMFYRMYCVSIHARVKRATKLQLECFIECIAFQSTPA